MKKILYIDADQNLLDYAESHLSSEGYEVQTALNAHAIFSRIRSFQPDLILLDVNLGDYNGLEVCKDLALEPFTRHIPVIMLSDNESLNRYRDYGALDKIAKPFDADHLIGVVNSHLQAKVIHINFGMNAINRSKAI